MLLLNNIFILLIFLSCIVSVHYKRLSSFAKIATIMVLCGNNEGGGCGVPGVGNGVAAVE